MDRLATGSDDHLMTITICLHGPESTGKSSIAPRLAARLGGATVSEYGRDWAESHGIAFTMTDLVLIAKGHLQATREALTRRPPYLVLDTDPLMTAVWADMLFGKRDPWFDRFEQTADFYLLFDIDLPWIADGTRVFGEPERRQRFFDLSKAELERRGLPWALVRGEGNARIQSALAAIEEAGLAPRSLV
jgi:NadR type nicotinamide-nucleotide adenylyltransferase